jgi:hypothetical protein
VQKEMATQTNQMASQDRETAFLNRFRDLPEVQKQHFEFFFYGYQAAQQASTSESQPDRPAAQ